jgi:hypothetical protein
MSSQKSEKSAARVRKKPPAPAEPPPAPERLNLGCGTLLIALCILGLLGKFLPHESRRTAAVSQPVPKPAAKPARSAAGETPSKPPRTAASERLSKSMRAAPQERADTLPAKPLPPAKKPAAAKTRSEAVPPSPVPADTRRPAVYNDPWDNSVAQVEHYIKRSLHDASSFEAQEWGKVEETKGGYRVRCTYRSRNLLGAVAIQTRTFLLNREGEVYAVKD